ncbi:MAG: hypothetical protein AB7U38_11745 [Hyphomicrobiales bacterium]
MEGKPRVNDCDARGLTPWDQVNCYCERAGDPGFWAEPANALTNAAFLLAAFMAWRALRASGLAPAERALPLALILIIAAVGAGSFLFHSLATVWSRTADVAPIGLFIALYVFAAYRRLVGLSVFQAAPVALIVVAATFAMPPWFNGSLGYAPALAALMVTAALLRLRGHAAAGWMAGATAAFALSLLLRSIDRLGPVCGSVPAGTHWAWHVLNACVLYMLMRALTGAGTGGAGRAAAGNKNPRVQSGRGSR